jgi:predicted kinase
MQYLIILQGVPGSGKSTLAEFLASSWSFGGREVDINSTDDFFVNCQTGQYQFNAAKLGENHAKNLDRSIRGLEAGRTVIVDNTNCQAWEPREYVKAAVRLGVPVLFIRCEGGFQSTHGVPADKVDAMKGRMEPLSVAACLNAMTPWERS